MLRTVRQVLRLRPGRPLSTQGALSAQSGALSAQPGTLPGSQVSIQGVQGDIDDPRFSLWLQNCQRWGLGDCQQKADELRTGKKTLDQLFKEQEELLKSISEKSEKFDNSNVEFVSPQGVQGGGEDCAQYQLWLRNCQQFGFGNCGQQLNDLQEGKKTLSQVFAEQDEVIRQAAEQWRNMSSAQLSTKDRLKRAVRDYGATVIVFHVSISVLSLSGFYALVQSGVDVVALLRYVGVGEAMIESRLAAGASTFVLAYAVHKLFAPARIAVTLGCVPFIVRYLRRINVLKKP